MRNAGLGKRRVIQSSPKLRRNAAIHRSNGKGRRIARGNAINSQKKLRVQKSPGEIYDIAGRRSIVFAKKRKEKMSEQWRGTLPPSGLLDRVYFGNGGATKVGKKGGWERWKK